MCQNLIPFSGWVIFQCVDTPRLFISSSINERLGCFHFVSVVNNAGNICVQGSAGILAFDSSGHIPYKWNCWNLLFIYLEIISVLWRSCTNIQSLGTSFIRLPLVTTDNKSIVIRTKTLALIPQCYLNYKLYLVFTIFSTTILLLLRDPIQDPTFQLITMSP